MSVLGHGNSVDTFHIVGEVRLRFVGENDAVWMHRVDEHIQCLPPLLGVADILEGEW